MAAMAAVAQAESQEKKASLERRKKLQSIRVVAIKKVLYETPAN